MSEWMWVDPEVDEPERQAIIRLMVHETEKRRAAIALRHFRQALAQYRLLRGEDDCHA